jgi:hypothetical protein
VREQTMGKGYPVVTWYAILAGVGIFPDPQTLHPPNASEARFNLAEIDDLPERSAAILPTIAPYSRTSRHAATTRCRSTSGGSSASLKPACWAAWGARDHRPRGPGFAP